MKHKIFFTLIGILLIFFGYATGRAIKTNEVMQSKMSTESTNDHITHSTTMDLHTEKELVNPNYYAPKILKLSAEKDTMDGYNLNIQTQNFRFTPQMVGKEVVQNTGHTHIYVNDVKVGRSYSDWYNIPDSFFKNGTNTISVTLNANNHNVWWSKNGTLEARSTIVINK